MDDIHWKSTNNDIADLKQRTIDNRLELRPPFQRKGVWGKSAQIMLMDTVLKNIPMPKIFLASIIKKDTPYFSVIDGQQRIRAILSFIRGEFSLQKPYVGEYKNKKFAELPENIRGNFLRYSLDYNEITDASEEQLREIYSRVNKYSTVLNKQELRRADFPGDFLKLAEKLAVNSFFDKAKIFTITNRRRFADAEYVSELLAGLMGGIQDKKNTLDDFYKEYANWDSAEKDKVEKEFVETLKDIHLIFNEKEHVGKSGPTTVNYCEELKFNGFISETRFKQKADFYALFFAINKLKRLGHNIADKNLENLRTDLLFMHKYTDPHSDIKLFREYATRCLSDANSKASRIWRVDFLFNILSGTYIDKVSVESSKLFSSLALDFILLIPDKVDVSEGCPSLFSCGKCHIECDLINQNFDEEDEGFIDNGALYEDYIVDKGIVLYWDKKETNYHLTNAKFICRSCSING